MTRSITLDLSETIVHRAQETAERTGRSLELVLSDWIERGSEQDDLTNVLLQTEHHLYSPLGGEDTAQALLDYLKSQEDKAGH